MDLTQLPFKVGDRVRINDFYPVSKVRGIEGNVVAHQVAWDHSCLFWVLQDEGGNHAFYADELELAHVERAS